MTQLIKNKPVIGITMGDAAGIGPEIVLKSLLDADIRATNRCVIIGDGRHLRDLTERRRMALKLVDFGEEEVDAIEIYDLTNLNSALDIGKDQAVTGKASAECIEAAVKLWSEGRIDAISTAPISKKAIALGGYDYPGHTEFLAKLTNTEKFAMSFFADKLRVVLLTTHISLSNAIDRVTTEALIDRISFADKTIRELLGRKIKIAVAGLNPHASEGGMFGSEEAERITPAIEHCRGLGIEVSGPYAPDTIFLRGYKGDFDAVIALYHDQATIAVKSLSFGSGVNVTLGLPLIRTSVDHGTAYDIAGKWQADESSMQAAIRLAGELAGRKYS
ncbi:MAG: 4-hydroxythreonine-4-phosphate dehydrogenase PdxA [Acidobacteria bacterium]|nr:4-hydroxythreonine-4-phosphate dehydrogenase PdxA [Acidobacteriota bacterium]MBP7475497.1 4-hydroxythreonine-4-phosphate dehydrogenase PdxA [Pyrinomonadaceae bacterium]MBP9110284.1 4-hydroxythreonine-4-phosphate dehydrogenase PdxA [Pyrinomonadaceae bacterium]